MRGNSFLTFLKEKSFIIVLALLIISAGAMVALFQAGGKAYEEQNQMAERQPAPTEKPAEVNEPAKTIQKDGGAEKTETVKKAAPAKKTDTKEKEKSEEAKTSHNVADAELEDQFLEMEEASAADVVAEGFSEAPEISLQWPVEGEVVLEYSMDHSIYFPTLAQYQYNPAMIIGVSEGTPVLGAAAGTVTDVGKSSEFGHYVTMDLGSGFEITYGQLFEITAQVGDSIEAGQQFALVAYPTRTYIEEGDNLYLKLTKDDAPVNPEFYLQ